MRIIIAAIAIVIVAIAGVLVVLHKPSTPTSSSTTTMQVIRAGSIDSCGGITKPGNYFLSANIKTAISSGACINITASDVALVCNQHSIIGSGPYSGVPPFSYGIEINGQNNVSVSSCAIANFSYGVYAHASSDVVLRSNNITSNYLSDAYFSGTQNSIISNNLMDRASSSQGALYLANGSSGNRILNNTIENNRVYGIGIDSIGNSYINNTLNYNPSSFYCGTSSSFPRSSNAEGNYCYNNTGCAFVSCGGINKPANLSAILLGNSIDSCGTVVSPGSYRLASNLNTSLFANTSNPAFRQSGMPCIKIDTNNTALNCRGFSITGAPVAILANDRDNVTIANCSISGSGYGVMLSNETDMYVSNMTFRNNTFAIELLNVTSSVISSIRSFGNKYGMYVLDASANNFLGFNTSKNQYGIYLSQSVGNLFSKGTAFNNSIVDVYATPDSANASYDLMQQTACGFTNTKWAGCRQNIASSLGYYPFSGCATLSRQGTYSLTSNIINPTSMCITVNTNNVTLNCEGHSLFQTLSTPGPAIYLNGRKNVTINNCGITGFTTAINISNSSGIGVYGMVAHTSLYGLSLSNVSNSVVEGSTFSGAANVSMKLLHVSGSSIIMNNVTYGVGNNYGILVNGSQRNIIENNTGSTNHIGVYFTGSSKNNTVMNNTMQLSGYADYLCNGNGGINDEIGGINYGSKKIGCLWMVALIKGTVTQSDCEVALQPGIYPITSDQLYNYGATCYSVFANGTTINCNGHTILATKGGTFALVKNVTGAMIENCTLKGFTRPIFVRNSGITILNNRIFNTNTTNAAITLIDGLVNSKILANNITTPYLGISMNFSSGAYLFNNTVTSASTAYQIASSIGFAVNNNTAAKSTGTGLVLSNTTSSIFENNMFLAKKGMVCLATSQTNTSNIDSGNNFCSSISGCAWMKSSSSTCH